jgi:hypothetical protein
MPDDLHSMSDRDACPTCGSHDKNRLLDGCVHKPHKTYDPWHDTQDTDLPPMSKYMIAAHLANNPVSDAHVVQVCLETCPKCFCFPMPKAHICNPLVVSGKVADEICPTCNRACDNPAGWCRNEVHREFCEIVECPSCHGVPETGYECRECFRCHDLGTVAIKKTSTSEPECIDMGCSSSNPPTHHPQCPCSGMTHTPDPSADIEPLVHQLCDDAKELPWGGTNPQWPEDAKRLATRCRDTANSILAALDALDAALTREGE